jgi:hypothetical protein
MAQLRSFKPLNAAGFFLRVAQMRPRQFQRLAIWDVTASVFGALLALALGQSLGFLGSGLGLIAQGVIYFFLITAWTRLFVTGDLPEGVIPIEFGRNEAFGAGAMAIMAGGFLVFAFIGALFIAIFAAGMGEAGEPGAWTVLAALFVIAALIYVSQRFTAAVALSLIEARLSILTAWRQSGDIWGRILLGNLIAAGVAALGLLVLAILAGLLGIEGSLNAQSGLSAASVILVILNAIVLLPSRLTAHSLAAVLALRGDDMSTPWLRQMDQLEQRSAERYDDFS